MSDWVEVNLLMKELSNRDLLRPGVLLEYENGDQYLVGGWRKSEGCTVLQCYPNISVKRYRVLWEGE